MTAELLEAITEMRRNIEIARMQLAGMVMAACPGPHRPVNHRDRRPWCAACGRTGRRRADQGDQRVTTTTMPTLTAARLVAGHVNLLWQQWANETDPDMRGCCPECCGPCNALRDLLNTGQLDDLYRVWLAQDSGADSATWDRAEDRIGRDWLTEAWNGDRGCGPHDVEESERSQAVEA